MIGFLILCGLLIFAAVIAIAALVAFGISVFKYHRETMTKEELEKNSKKVKEHIRRNYDDWKRSPSWTDENLS